MRRNASTTCVVEMEIDTALVHSRPSSIDMREGPLTDLLHEDAS